MQSFLAKHQITQVTHPLYSPDLASCDFWLLPKLKSPLKGKRSQTIDKIQENTMGQLMVTGQLCEVPRSTLKGTKASLSYVQCFLYLLQQMALFFILHGWIPSGQTLSIYLSIWNVHEIHIDFTAYEHPVMKLPCPEGLMPACEATQKPPATHRSVVTSAEVPHVTVTHYIPQYQITLFLYTLLVYQLISSSLLRNRTIKLEVSKVLQKRRPKRNFLREKVS